MVHPYYKLGYFEIAWGGEAKQAAEIAAGNLNAKNWMDEARKVVEPTVRFLSSFARMLTKR